MVPAETWANRARDLERLIDEAGPEAPRWWRETLGATLQDVVTHYTDAWKPTTAEAASALRAAANIADTRILPSDRLSLLLPQRLRRLAGLLFSEGWPTKRDRQRALWYALHETQRLCADTLAPFAVHVATRGLSGKPYVRRPPDGLTAEQWVRKQRTKRLILSTPAPAVPWSWDRACEAMRAARQRGKPVEK